MLNRAEIIGNLTRDPEIRTTPAGQSVATFSVATNLIWVDSAGNKQQKTEFHNIVVWKKLAEVCAKYAHKGSKVFLEGRLETTQWIGQDGAKRSQTKIIASNVRLLDPKPATPEKPVEAITQETPAPATIEKFVDESYNGGSGEEEIKIENIPF